MNAKVILDIKSALGVLIDYAEIENMTEKGVSVVYNIWGNTLRTVFEGDGISHTKKVGEDAEMLFDSHWGDDFFDYVVKYFDLRSKY